ncbi:ketopantoate reductase PanE/ApbA-domain-containing protein [Aspergillus ambiguus]|uniref:ketopantoate reductase family protein n=1 Tax=Aspergillus ambiguus TaxID=176160 RepID=UPI003CCCF5CD
MVEEAPIDVLLFGLGAIGSFYAFVLQRCPRVRLTVVARSNYEAVKSNGVFIDSANHGEHRFHPHQVIRLPSEASKTFDYVVCAHKAIDMEDAVAKLAPTVGASSTIVIVQNGVGNEDPFRRAFPTCSIISCVAWVGASQPSPGVVQHTVSEHTELGLFPNPGLDAGLERNRMGMFASLLEQGETSFHIVDDIQRRKWEKVVWNCAWNATTALTSMDTHAWLSSSTDAESWTRRLMLEVIAAGKACGVPLEDDLVDKLMEKIHSLPPVQTSMQVDRASNRPMEIEVILGYPLRKAREFGVQTPLLETLYLLLRAIDGKGGSKKRIK